VTVLALARGGRHPLSRRGRALDQELVWEERALADARVRERDQAFLASA
jgi:hypothetical protein